MIKNVLSDKLIIAIIDKKSDSKNERKVLKYGMFSPMTGEYLDSDEICKEDKIIFTDSIEDKLLQSKVNLKIIKEFVNDGVDIFDLSSPFYNDLCFQYNSSKDVAMKDRILEFFPNITLCEEGCDIKGINMTTITAICECYYSKIKREDNLKNKVLEQAQISNLEEIISSANIYVIKCIKLIFDINRLKRCYGVFIVLGFILIEIICSFYYCLKNIFAINKFIFGITNKYISNIIKPKDNKINNIKFIQEANKINSVFKLKGNSEKNSIKQDGHKIIKKTKSTKKADFNKNINQIKKNKVVYSYKLDNNIDLSNLSDKHLYSEKKLDIPNNHNSLFINVNDDIDINIDDFLQTELDDMDYDEAIRKDNRKFCPSFLEKLKKDQILVNTFYTYEPIRPRAIKIILLILQINLYFFVNGLFYDEEYISKIYHIEKDTFLTVAERFFDNLIDVAFVGIIVNYIIEFFFIEELKIKKILKFEKDNILVMKYEMIKLLKSIKIRYLIFIIISFVISFISLIHIFCFNIIYNHTMKEWITFSFIIILTIILATFLLCLLQTCLRILSFKFKSETLFKLSQI